MSGRSSSSLGGRDLGQLAVLGRQLGRGRDLDALGLLERALGEGREPGQPLDLDVEQLAAHRALLGGRVDVEDVAADGELAAVLDLVDALVAAGHEPLGGLVEVDQAALLDREAVRAQLRVGHLLGERRGATGHAPTAPLAVDQRVERGDAQARRGAAAARGATRSGRRGPGRSAPAAGARNALQVGGQVARRAVVAGHDQRGPLRVRVEQRREQVRAQAGRDEGALRLLRARRRRAPSTAASSWAYVRSWRRDTGKRNGRPDTPRGSKR